MARPKIEKIFKPSYEEMVSYAQSLEGENLSVVVNPAGNQHKFLVGKKPYLVMQKQVVIIELLFVLMKKIYLDIYEIILVRFLLLNHPKVEIS